jgi:isoquinoline 1-oxidoreductase beta subunit
MSETEISRRQFLGQSLLTAGGFVVAFYLPLRVREAFAENNAAPVTPAATMKPNAFIQIAPDDSITMVINKLEMGQGVNTSMAQLLAEELECDWSKIRSVSAPVDAVYNHTTFGMQMTGGSSALISSWEQHRKLGAGMREMLKTAAAARWGVPVDSVKAANGFILHPQKGKLSYGSLSEAAAKLPFPENPPLKKSADFKLIGKSMKRVDAAAKSDGTAKYGIDIRLPGMLHAVVARPPIAGAGLGKVNEDAARAVPGVVDVVKFGDRVAVLARNTHAAKKGREALAVAWNIPSELRLSSTGIMAGLRAAAPKGIVADKRGNVDEAFKGAARIIEAEYEFPFLAHACMEPMNCTATYDGEKAEFWAGFQMPTLDRVAAAKVLGLKPEQVTLNTVYAGGSFGRRAAKDSDYLVEAAALVKKVKKPLKITWTREDDMHGGMYRPMNFHRAKIGLDAQGNPIAWHHEIAGQSIMAGGPMEAMIKEGLESVVTEGVSETKYALPNFRCLQARVPSPITTLWWRSVGHTHTAFAMETLIDEVAVASKQDPLALRKKLLAKEPRHMAVLNLLEKETGWGKRRPPKGRAWGLAIHDSFKSVVGHVAEVSLENGRPRVHRIWSAVHCGQIVNPEGAKTQVEGAIGFGLSALHQEIRFDGGQVVQQNFLDYPVLRINEMPEVKVAFVPSDETPTGLGEPGVPPVLPAVANAYYQLTKKRLRKLPFGTEA